MKKTFLFLTIFALILSPAFAGSFPDVPEDHANYEAIEYLDQHAIINGYDDGTFGPDNLVNRAEATKIIVGAYDISHEGTYEEKFPDVPDDQWFFPYVMGANKAGIISGYDDGTYKPGDNVNLAELLKIVVLASGAELPEVEEDVFLDVPADAWYAPHALYARENNVVLADEYGELNAEQSMTRASFAEVIYRMMIVMETGEPYPLHKNWDVYESSYLPFKIKYDGVTWQVIENKNEVVFFRADKGFGQFSPARMYPGTGLVRVTLDENAVGTGANAYFGNIKTVFSGAQYTEFTFGGMDALEVLYPDKRIVDWYVYTDDGVLAVYTEFGYGALGYQVKQYIKAMLSTLEYQHVETEDYSELLSEILSIVLVEGKGMENLDKLPDTLIIETDAIGVGTGPVDYYYSEAMDYTFKYERSVDVILDTRSGRTSAF